MINALQSDIGVNVIASIIASLFFLATVSFGENTRNAGASSAAILTSTISIRSPLRAKTLVSSV